jgi:hypothetical protein
LCYSRFPCGARNKLGFHRDRNSLSPLGEDWTISSLLCSAGRSSLLLRGLYLSGSL